MFKHFAKVLAVSAVGAFPLSAQSVFLNFQNSTVALGSTMSANPFANRPTAASLASIIDAPTAASSEFHNQSTHVWVSNGLLELDFDFGVEYDLTTLHFWNYHSESHDVDNINFNFYDANHVLVGSLLNVAPALGGTATDDTTPIFAQDYSLVFPSRVRYVNALLTGSNDQVDFNNIGFTGELAATVVPEPSTVMLMLLGVGAIAGVRVRRRVR